MLGRNKSKMYSRELLEWSSWWYTIVKSCMKLCKDISRKMGRRPTPKTSGVGINHITGPNRFHRPKSGAVRRAVGGRHLALSGTHTLLHHCIAVCHHL